MNLKKRNTAGLYKIYKLPFLESRAETNFGEFLYLHYYEAYTINNKKL
jgi:hypothetical protein